MSVELTDNKQATPGKTSGVVMFAFGFRTYYWAAYNLIFSIKKHNPNVSVTLYVDKIDQALYWCTELKDWADHIFEVDKELMYTAGKFDPGKVKVSLYDLLPYDKNLYLDVDAIAIKDIQPLIDELSAQDKQYISHTVGYHKGQGNRDCKTWRHIPSMQWAWADDIWKHWELNDDSVLPAINSSLQYIEKGEISAAIYEVAKQYYIENPLPLEKLRMRWGNGQPDELYMNAAFAKLNYDPGYHKHAKVGNVEPGFIHFAMARGLTYPEVIKNFYLQSYYGGKGFTSAFYVEWIERLLEVWFKEAGGNHEYKLDRIVAHKHADNKK